MADSHTLTRYQESTTRQAETIRRLVAALTEIRLVCWETHTGQERAHAALSRVDQIARRGLG